MYQHFGVKVTDRLGATYITCTPARNKKDAYNQCMAHIGTTYRKVDEDVIAWYRPNSAEMIRLAKEFKLRRVEPLSLNFWQRGQTIVTVGDSYATVFRIHKAYSDNIEKALKKKDFSEIALEDECIAPESFSELRQAVIDRLNVEVLKCFECKRKRMAHIRTTKDGTRVFLCECGAEQIVYPKLA